MKFQPLLFSVLAALQLPPVALACGDGGDCFGPARVEHVRRVKRMQPEAHNATSGPSRALEWGQLNFLHTTDTHGWLEGHLKETNYGADWGDFASFVAHMRARAAQLDVDLLLIDTGDLHDGTGLSDATSPDGTLSNDVFDQVDYDLLTIGNHELYLADVAYQDFNSFSKFWGDRYLTSNVQILNPATNEYEYIGQQYRYFTTGRGIRVLAFGVLFDFTGNANVTRVTPAKDMVQESWFRDAVNDTARPVDLFLVIGHNTAMKAAGIGTLGFVHDAIRAVHAATPIQMFGGHSHVRDFRVYDQASTALESGRYCETLGWLAMSGFDKQPDTGYGGAAAAAGVPHPTRPAVNGTTPSAWTYARRYLDWNRLTFEYHALGSQTTTTGFDTATGLNTTALITGYRARLNLTDLHGCAPRSWCMTCTEFASDGSIFSLLSSALAVAAVSATRADKARMGYVNTGSVRFDLYKGPFTRDDAFIVSPLRNKFVYIADVPYAKAKGALDWLNTKSPVSRRGQEDDFGTMSLSHALPGGFGIGDSCVDPVRGVDGDGVDGGGGTGGTGGTVTRPDLVRRQVTGDLTPGYVTTDDFGSDGDDTAHSPLSVFAVPHFFGSQGEFPSDGTDPSVVDMIFTDYIQSAVIEYLGSDYTADEVHLYIDDEFTTQTYLPKYVEQSADFQRGLSNCTIF